MSTERGYRRFLNMRVAAALWLVAAVLGLSSRMVEIVAASQASLFRRGAPLTDIRPEQGAAYVASTGKPDLSSHEAPSSGRVLENGRPLGPGNALHDTIRNVGRGHFSFWHDYVYLSASDGTDPRTNGRTYTIDYPVLPAATAGAVARASILVFVIAALATLLLIARRVSRETAAAVFDIPRIRRSAGRMVHSVAVLWMVAMVLGFAATAAFAIRIGTITWPWPLLAVETITAEQGVAFVAPVGRSDLSSHEEPSAARILEDGRPLGPGNTQHADIRQGGRGRYSFWHDYVLFSASDSSDPRTNGRRYSITYPPVGETAAQALYFAAAVSLAAAVAASAAAIYARRAVVARSLWVLWALIGAAVARAIASIVSRRRRIGHASRRPAAIAVLVMLWVGLGALIAADREVHLARTGQSTRLWASAPLQGFVAETGRAYVAPTGRMDLSSHLGPSTARVLENGRPLGPANAQHVDIRELGQGRYSFWHDYVIFAASDSSDPRTNGRTYTLTYPEVGATEARVLFLLTIIVGMAALVATAVLVRTRTFGEAPVRLLESAVAQRRRALIGVAAGGLVLVALMRAAQADAALVKSVWLVVLLVNFAAAWHVRRSYGGALPARVLTVFVLALAAGFIVLTTMAPHKWPGCHTTEPISAWDAFCVAPDSASYYMGYQPGSTRNPLYAWFIGALTTGTEFESSAYRNQATPGALITNDSDPLFRVVRVQIVLLLAAALALATAAMIVTRGVFPAVIFLALYDYGYFTAYELNIVLTEPLVQTFLFLLVAAFLLFLWRPRPAWLLSAAVCCALAYLTRQAAAYSALFVGVMVLRGLAEDWRRWWKPSVAAAAVLALLVSIPDLYAFALTGSLTRSQESLQYQYRIVHAMQYATLQDLEVMPDASTREWLAKAIPLRDKEHRMVEAKYTTEYDRMTYYINQNLYAVAMPVHDPLWVEKLPLAAGGYTRVSEFYMAVATPILARHRAEYASFAFRFWQLGLSYFPVARAGLGRVNAWVVYGLLGLLILTFRDRYALAAATLIGAHWAHVALASMFAVPIPRMVWASDGLVLIAALLLGWRLIEPMVAAGAVARRVNAPIAETTA